jgi:hypothetical protein
MGIGFSAPVFPQPTEIIVFLYRPYALGALANGRRDFRSHEI